MSDDRHANSVWLLPVAALGGVVAGLSVWLAFESNHVDQPGTWASTRAPTVRPSS